MRALDDSGPATRVDIAVCGACGANNGLLARFCGTCGHRLLVHCWSCGTAAPVGQQFCASCGTALVQLSGEQATVASGQPVSLPAPERTGMLSTLPSVPVSEASESADPAQPGRTSPPLVLGSARDEIASGLLLGGDGASLVGEPSGDDDDRFVEERRLVTVLFADIVGFTTVSERLDPEDVRELSARVLSRLAEAVTLFGGTVDKFIGDAVMALFGAPVAHEDDPTRAVHAALAMHQSVASVEHVDAAGDPIRLRLRIGVNTGEVIAGARDVGGHREYTVFGDVVNTAARLQTAAEPGTIYLGAETARRVGRTFDLAAVEPLKLKGKAELVAAFEVRGRLALDMPPLGGHADGKKLPLVGRLDEVRQLRHQLQELSRGRGQLLAVVGEHGIGKSRLLAEVREYGTELGVGWIEAAAPSHGQGLSYRLVRETLARLLGLRTDGPDALVIRSLRERLAALRLPDLLGPLAFVLGLELEDDGIGGLSAMQVQWRVVEAMRRLLRTMAADRPLVLVLDALQWADASSIDLLIELMSLSDEAPILFAYVFTPDRDAPSWTLEEQATRTYPHRYAEVVLAPLGERAAREMMCSLLSCAETPAQVEDLVLARTDGNPFFIEEVLRALIDSGALRRDGDRWVADGDVRDLNIPGTLLATVMARIDRLPAGVRRMLQVAAVIGRELSERVLRRVMDGGVELDRQIREALRAGLLREEAVIPERRFVFTQALIQEAAMRSLLLRRRREIHVQIGWALEEIYAESLEEQYAELARHFSEGESWERAFRYARLAAEQSAAAYANDEAVWGFTVALESARRSAAGADPEVLAMIAERRADIRGLIGDYADALTDYQAALDHHLGELNDAPAGSPAHGVATGHVGIVALKIARLRSYQGDLAGTRGALALAFEHLPADSPDLASAWSLTSTLSVWESNMEAARSAGLRAVEIARERGTYQHRAEAFEAVTHPSMLGVASSDLLDKADAWVRLARDRPEDRPILIRALLARGLIQVWGRWRFDEQERKEILEAAELSRVTGSVAGENTARGILGAGLILLGEWERAEVELRRSAGQVTTLAGVGGISEWWLMLLLTLRGHLDESAQQMARWLEDVNNTHRRVVMRALLGLNRLRAGDRAAARAAFAEACEAALVLRCGHCDVTLHALAAEGLVELGDLDGAAHSAREARAGGGQFGRPAATLAADRADGVLALLRGEIAEGRAILERALGQAEALGQPYELARTLVLVARACLAAGDPETGRLHRERAEAIFERLGAGPDLAALKATPALALPV